MAPRIYVRLYEELNDYLPEDMRKRRFDYPLNGIGTVEDLLQSLGVPLPEVELVLVNGESVEFSQSLAAGDSVSIYPVFESLDVSPVVRARGKALRRTRFIAGPGLSRLGFYLRLFGFDVLDRGPRSGEQLIRLAEAERRILLTRDPGLSKNPGLSRVYLVREEATRNQLAEVFTRFNLDHSARFSLLRSMIARILIPRNDCNG